MPGAEWFPGARLNYAEHALRHERPGATRCCICPSGSRSADVVDELGGKVRILATQLRKLGVKPGDRVVAYLPNIPEALIAMLATTSIGAIWSSCGPDFGTRGVLDRFSQLAPKVLLLRGRLPVRRQAVQPPARKCEKIIARADTLERVIYLPYLDRGRSRAALGAHGALGRPARHPPVPASEFQFEQVPFDQPLWILFSSGTTGLPKAIVHSHGGILLEQLKRLQLQLDLRAGERMFFFTTTGWMMWNFLVERAAVGRGAGAVRRQSRVSRAGHAVEDGARNRRRPSSARARPIMAILRRRASCRASKFDLSKLESIMLAGSPVTRRMHGLVLREREAGSVGRARQRRHGHLLRLRRRRRHAAGVRGRDPGALRSAARRTRSTSAARKW